MRRSSAAAGAAVAALLLAGCGGDDDGADVPETAKADIAGFAFVPDPIRVKAGGTVTWRNADKAPHTAETGDARFDTGRLDTGESKAVTLDEPGKYTYYCVFHRFMTGTVEVVE